jgi:hypothetical protein
MPAAAAAVQIIIIVLLLLVPVVLVVGDEAPERIRQVQYSLLLPVT